MTRIILGVILGLVGLGVGVLISNNIRADYLREWGAEQLQACEADGLTGCHIDYIYDGLILLDIECVGWR